VLGIGGIGADQAADVARAGAAGVAAIAAFLPSDAAKIADTVHEAVRRMRMAFDSTLPPS
jgi:thiamine monophosphate synthase